MRFPVVVNRETMSAECRFATLADLKIVSGWAAIRKTSREAVVQDAAEFAGLACKRWRFYRKAGRYARNIEELQRRAASCPDAEIALMFIARASWHQPLPQLGICLCRRTWCNGLCVDFLTVAPHE